MHFGQHFAEYYLEVSNRQHIIINSCKGLTSTNMQTNIWNIHNQDIWRTCVSTCLSELK